MLGQNHSLPHCAHTIALPIIIVISSRTYLPIERPTSHAWLILYGSIFTTAATTRCYHLSPPPQQASPVFELRLLSKPHRSSGLLFFSLATSCRYLPIELPTHNAWLILYGSIFTITTVSHTYHPILSPPMAELPRLYACIPASELNEHLRKLATLTTAYIHPKVISFRSVKNRRNWQKAMPDTSVAGRGLYSNFWRQAPGAVNRVAFFSTSTAT